MRARLLLLILFPIMVHGTLWAQDSHYWSNQYGSRSALMGGAVVGGVRDTSAGYYNPGALGFVESSSLSVSGNGIRLGDLHIAEGVGGGEALDSEEVEMIPLLISGVLKPKGMPGRHVFSYSILARQSHDLRVSARREADEDILTRPGAEGEENFVGQFTRNDRLLDLWGGLSYAYRLTDELSAGVSGFVALRSQTFNQSIFARAANVATGATAATDATLAVNYWNMRLVWKAGMALELEGMRLGFAVTPPSYSLGGSGTVAADFTVMNADFDGDGTPDSFVGDDRQEELDTKYRSPLSVAVGAELDLGEKTRLGLAAEWFAALDEYSVIRPESRNFIRSVSPIDPIDSRSFLRVAHEAESVLNGAAALEHVFSERISGYLSFRTDFKTIPDDRGEGVFLGLTDWDLYHATVGSTFRGEHADIGLGLQFSYGQRDDFPQFVNFNNPTERGNLAGELGEAEAEYKAITFIIGGTYYFR